MALLTADQRVFAKATNGEPTIWTGRPSAAFRLRRGDAARLAPLILVIPFIAFWESMVLRIPPSAGFLGIVFPLFGFGVFLLVLWQTAGEILWSACTRSRTYYALTMDGSAVIYTDVFGGTTKRVYLPSLTTIDLDLKADGSGSITFGQAQLPPWWMRNQYNLITRPPAFDFIPRAATVYDLCTKLQHGKTA